MAGIIVGLVLLAAAVFIGIKSVREIVTPHHAPARYTWLVLALVIRRR
jgi:divalent metal cation (Fe/Co/Zn/Cd) transporter